MSGSRSDLEIPDDGRIQSGPETFDQPEPAERQPTARELMMEQILANRERALAAELAAADEQVEHRPEHELSQGDATYDDEPQQQRREPRRDAQPEPQQPDAPQLFPVDTVDGQKLYVTQDQLLQLASMGAVANQALHQYRSQQQHTPPAPPQQPIVDSDRIRGTVKAIQYGDEDSAATALEDLVAHVAARAGNADAVIDRRLAEESARQKLARDTEVIQREYPDIMGNKHRAIAASEEVKAIRQWAASTGQTFDDLLIYREAGNRVRQSFGTAPEQSGRQTYSDGRITVRRSTAEIEGRKRAAPRAMSQVIDRRSAAPQAPRAPSGAELVDRMRAARGQPPIGRS